jgi:hypothetical protein
MGNPEKIVQSKKNWELSYRIHKTRTETKRYVFYVLVHVLVQMTFHQNPVIWRTKITKFWQNGNDSKQPYCHPLFIIFCIHIHIHIQSRTDTKRYVFYVLVHVLVQMTCPKLAAVRFKKIRTSLPWE